MVAPAPVDGVSGLDDNPLGDGHDRPVANRVLVGHDAICALREHGPRHDLDAGIGPLAQRSRPHSRGLHRGDPELAHARRQCGGAKGIAVHGHPVEGGKVAVRAEVGPEHTPVRLRQGAVLPGQRGHAPKDQLLRVGRCWHVTRGVRRSQS